MDFAPSQVPTDDACRHGQSFDLPYNTFNKVADLRGRLKMPPCENSMRVGNSHFEEEVLLTYQLIEHLCDTVALF